MPLAPFGHQELLEGLMPTNGITPAGLVDAEGAGQLRRAKLGMVMVFSEHALLNMTGSWPRLFAQTGQRGRGAVGAPSRHLHRISG